MKLPYQTIPEMILNVTERYADKVLFKEKVKGEWISITGQESRETIRLLTDGLTTLGLRPGDHMAIMASNCSRWAFADYAITCLGGAQISIYPTLIAEQAQYIIEHSGAKLVFTMDGEQTEKILQVWDECPRLNHVVCLNDEYQPPRDEVITFSQLLELGRKAAADESVFIERCQAVKTEDPVGIIYTSGTTGTPRGVVLTHNNLMSNIAGGLERLLITDEHTFLSFLPLSHSLEKMVDVLVTTVGGTVAYAEAMDKVVGNMGEVEPTHVVAVPRFFEKVYTAIQTKFATGSFLKRKITDWAQKTAYAYVEATKAGTVTPRLEKRYQRADKLVFEKVRGLLGRNFTCFVSGGAPLPAEVGRFFQAAGIHILEGYGLTETSPVIALNPRADYRFGTVGPPLVNCEVKIAADGEILTRGSCVMQGYYKDEAGTREVIDEDGWFHTGDIGMLEDGYLRITDRKKNILVTAGGKNVAPAPIEAALQRSRFVEHALLIGDRRKFISAIIVPDFEALGKWLADQQIQIGDQRAMVKDERVRALYETEIGKVMETFSRFEAVKQFILLHETFTIADGTLTPKLSIRKHNVLKRYADEIEALYAASESGQV